MPRKPPLQKQIQQQLPTNQNRSFGLIKSQVDDVVDILSSDDDSVKFKESNDNVIISQVKSVSTKRILQSSNHIKSRVTAASGVVSTITSNKKPKNAWELYTEYEDDFELFTSVLPKPQTIRQQTQQQPELLLPQQKRRQNRKQLTTKKVSLQTSGVTFVTGDLLAELEEENISIISPQSQQFQEKPPIIESRVQSLNTQVSQFSELLSNPFLTQNTLQQPIQNQYFIKQQIQSVDNINNTDSSTSAFPCNLSHPSLYSQQSSFPQKQTGLSLQQDTFLRQDVLSQQNSGSFLNQDGLSEQIYAGTGPNDFSPIALQPPLPGQPDHRSYAQRLKAWQSWDGVDSFPDDVNDPRCFVQFIRLVHCSVKREPLKPRLPEHSAENDQDILTSNSNNSNNSTLHTLGALQPTFFIDNNLPRIFLPIWSSNKLEDYPIDKNVTHDDKASHKGASDGDDDIEILHYQRNQNPQDPLIHFVHPRLNCQRLNKSNCPLEAYCSNCFCWICDSHVELCGDWKFHSQNQSNFKMRQLFNNMASFLYVNNNLPSQRLLKDRGESQSRQSFVEYRRSLADNERIIFLLLNPPAGYLSANGTQRSIFAMMSITSAHSGSIS